MHYRKLMILTPSRFGFYKEKNLSCKVGSGDILLMKAAAANRVMPGLLS